MEVEKLESTETKVKELTKNQKNDLFTNLVLGKDVTEIIKTKHGDFKVKFPRAKDLEAIAKVLAFRINGLSVSSIDPAVYSLMQQTATLDVLIVSGPAWYENAKAENNFTWADCPTQDFISEVYAKAYEFRLKVQKLLDGDTNKTDSGLDSGSSDNDFGGPGLFENLSGSARSDG